MVKDMRELFSTRETNRDELTSTLRFAELLLQVLHVDVFVAVALGFAEADPVDDGGVVEAVADHSILLAKEGFEETCIGIEAAREKDRILRSVEL